MIARSCMKDACQTRAQLLPVLIVQEVGSRPRFTVRLVLNFPLCVYCSRAMTVGRLITEPTWTMLDGVLGKKEEGARADRANAQLEFVTIEGPEAQQLSIAPQLRMKTVH